MGWVWRDPQHLPVVSWELSQVVPCQCAATFVCERRQKRQPSCAPAEGELHLDRLLPVEEVEAEEEAAEAAPEAGGAKAVKKAGAAAGAGGAKANKPHAVFADPNLE